MADIVPQGDISESFIRLADCGDSSDLTPNELNAFQKHVEGLSWLGVGDCAGFGVCEITRTRGPLFTLLGE